VTIPFVPTPTLPRFVVIEGETLGQIIVDRTTPDVGYPFTFSSPEEVEWACEKLESGEVLVRQFFSWPLTDVELDRLAEIEEGLQ
jgi:hypothetical protein